MNAAFILKNNHLAYDRAKQFLSTDLSVIEYEFSPVPPPPIPPTVSSGSGNGASWGGGSLSIHEKGFQRPKKKRHGSPYKQFIKQVAQDVALGLIEKTPQAGPLEVATVEIPETRLLEETIRTLRKRVTFLEAHIRKLKGEHAQERAGLSSQVADQAETLGELQTLILKLKNDLKLEEVRNAVSEAVRARVHSAMAGLQEETPGQSKLVIGVLAYLAIETLIPDDLEGLKLTGRVAAGAVVLSGLVEML